MKKRLVCGGCGGPKAFYAVVCAGCRLKPLAQLQRWARKVRYPETPDGCWEWVASRNSQGYGHFKYMGRIDSAHRAGYQILVGEIPEGMTLDHLCRNPGCVNPDHLEPVTNRENILRGVGISAQQARKTHCINGHPLSGNDVVSYGKCLRVCKACRRFRDKKKYAARDPEERKRERREQMRAWRAQHKAKMAVVV